MAFKNGIYNFKNIKGKECTLKSEVTIFHLWNRQKWKTLIMLELANNVEKCALAYYQEGIHFIFWKSASLGRLVFEHFYVCVKDNFGNTYWNFKCTYSLASNCILRLYSANKHGHICKDSCRRPKQLKWPWIVDWWNKVWFIPIISYHMVTGRKYANDI